MILAAGAIGSPQLLLLSGIGPPEHLREVGIAVRHELPGVGRNLQDHPFVTMLWELSEGPTLYGADKPKNFAEWLLRRSGPLTSTVAEVVAFVRTRAGLPAADIQFHMGAVYFEDHGSEEFDGDAMTIGPVLDQPRGPGPRSGCAPPTRWRSRGSSPTRSRARTTSPRSSPGWSSPARSPPNRR